MRNRGVLMVLQVIKLGLIADPFKLTDSIIRKLRGIKIFLKMPTSGRQVDKAIKIARYLEVDGVVLPLSSVVRSNIIQRLSEAGNFRLVLRIDIRKVTNELKLYINTITQIHEIIPLIEVGKTLNALSILELPRVTTIIIDYKTLQTSQEYVTVRRLLNKVVYLRDYILSLVKTRNITIGSIITKMSYQCFEIIRELVNLSTLFVVTRLDEALILQSVLEKFTTSQFYDYVTKMFVPEEANVEVTIE